MSRWKHRRTCLDGIPLCLLLAGVPAILPVHAAGAELVVAAASDLNFAMKEIVEEFQAATGHTVRLSLGSSGNFHAQIRRGAPFDLFFSADISYARTLADEGWVEEGTLYVYARGTIGLWVRKGAGIDPDAGWKGLLENGVRRIAIANPRHAPYGKAAVAFLRTFRIYDQVAGKLVLGENILQAAQFVRSGAADVGILASSLARSPALQAEGRFWMAPEDSYPRLDQAAVILKGAATRGRTVAARRLMAWIREPAGQRILEKYGFLVPGPHAGERAR